MKLLVFSKKSSILFVALEKVVYGIHLSVDPPVLNNIVREYKLPEQSSDGIILNIALSENEDFLVVVWNNKTISCWNVSDAAFRGSKVMKKKAATLVTAVWKGTHHSAIVGDRSGDICGYNLPDLNKEVILGGHTSSAITDSAFSVKNNLLITADRDEKIRYSSFPDVETISGFSLGHTSVVSSVSTINNQYLASVGWDHKLFIWNLQTYAKVNELTFSSISSVKASTNTAADQEEDGKGMEVEGEEQNPEQERQEEQQPQNDEGNDEGADDKNYDEESYGNYPFKITTSGLASSAVLFKSEPKIEFVYYQVHPSDVNISTQEIALPGIPIDVLSFQLNHVWYWLVILPFPFLFELYAQRDQATIERVTPQFFSPEFIQSLGAKQSQLVDTFNQASFISLLGYDGDSGKYSLPSDIPALSLRNPRY
jgi:hypothetical protein